MTTTPAPRSKLSTRVVSTIILLLLLPAFVLVGWNLVKTVYYRATLKAGPVEGIAWRTDHAAAVADAGAAGKPMMLVFTADWCPPCQVMKAETWPDAAVQAAVSERFIPVYINPDEPASRDVMMRYAITGFPTVILTDAAGRPYRQAHFLTAEEMVQFLSAVPATATAPAQ